MVHQTTFGRRATPQRQSSRAAQPVEPAPPVAPSVAAENPIDQFAAVRKDLAIALDDPELREWRQARQQHSRMPWRQLFLMASLCFGIASLVLPDSVNDSLDWVLYGLMAASLYAGLSRRLG